MLWETDRLLPHRARHTTLVGATTCCCNGAHNTLTADKAVDGDARVLEPLTAAGKIAAIPPRANRSSPRAHDRGLDGARHLTGTSLPGPSSLARPHPLREDRSQPSGRRPTRRQSRWLN